MLRFALDYRTCEVGRSVLVHADCFEWLGRVERESIHGVVTDPPYGVKEYDFDQLRKKAEGSGGIWRIPPSFDGNVRRPLPRFTDLKPKERRQLYAFFVEWARALVPVLVPGAHVFIAGNVFLVPLVFDALVEGGLEYRGQIIRSNVVTLRGGDRPKNAEAEFPEACTMPRATYEPWGLFRRPLPAGMRVSDCLRTYGTGALRRRPDDRPFMDTIPSRKTPRAERRIADHDNLKPQHFLRQLVHAVLPTGEGVICDPFMGSGSTIAAAEAMGLQAVGVERFAKYYDMACGAVPQLAALEINPFDAPAIEPEGDGLDTEAEVRLVEQGRLALD